MDIKIDKLNFTVGPVMMENQIREAGARQIPYFRTSDFSQLMKENEEMLLKLVKAEEGSRAVFLTGSGTAAMEMAVMNSFTEQDKVLVINGGGFGERFEDLCVIYHIPYESIQLSPGETLKKELLSQYNNRGFSGFLVNMHETSTGVLYDMKMIGDFCKKNHLFLVVDAISAFLADSIDMSEWGINMLITSSQKALALPPGMSFLLLDKKAIQRVQQQEMKSMYFDINNYLKNGERGQTPFTPAVGVLIQLNLRLTGLMERGIDNEILRVRDLANYFREGIKGLPFVTFAETPSNAVTAVTPLNKTSAYHYFERLDQEYNIWVCPNGGDMKDKIFRVGHIGNLCQGDYDDLINALREIAEEEAMDESKDF